MSENHVGYNGWIWREDVKGFFPPIPYPLDGKDYDWDEDALDWYEVPSEEINND
jgi:hypothetical protein